MAGMQKQEVDRMRALLVDAITTLCRSGLRYTRDMRVEGLIGITLDEADVILVNVNKTFETALKEKEREEATPKKDVDGRRSSSDETTPSKRRRHEKEDDIIIDRVIPPRKDTMGFGSPSAKRMRGSEHAIRQSPHKATEKGPAQMMWTEVNRTTPQKQPGTPIQSPSAKNREMKIEILSSDEEDADGRKIKKSRIGRRAMLPSNVHLTSQLNQLVTGPSGSTAGTTVIQVGQSPSQIRQVTPVGNQYQQAQFQQAQTFPPEAVQCDKVNRSLLVASKVRACVRCSRCKKARCVYSSSRLSKNQMIYLQNMIKKGEYICGRALVSGPDQSMVVRRSQDCRSPMETAYYGAPSVSFPQCCYYCGSTQNLLNDSYMKELQARYASVRPLCAPCRKQGKLARTWGHKLPMEGGRPMNVLPAGAVVQQGYVYTEHQGHLFCKTRNLDISTVMTQFQRNPPVPVAIRMANPPQPAAVQVQQTSTPSPLPSNTSSTPSPLTTAPGVSQPAGTPETPSPLPSSLAKRREGQADDQVTEQAEGQTDSEQAEAPSLGKQEQGEQDSQSQEEQEQQDGESMDAGQDPQQSDAQSSSDAGQAEEQQGDTSSTPAMTPQHENGSSPQEVATAENAEQEQSSVDQHDAIGQALSETDKLQPDQLTAEFQRIISESQKVILDPIFIKPDIHVQQTQEFVEVSELAQNPDLNGTPTTMSMQQPNTPPPPTCTSPGVAADDLSSADLNALSPLQIEPSGDGVWPDPPLPGSPSPTSMEQQ